MRDPVRSTRVAAAVLAASFTVHVLNGLVIERAVLGFTSYADYSRADQLDEAIGSWPWRASGLAHLVSVVAVLVLAEGLARLLDDARRRSGWLVRRLGTVAAVGFAVIGLGNTLGAQVVALLQDQNPEQRAVPVLAFTLMVAVGNGIAIVATAGVALIVGAQARRTDLMPSWLTVLSIVAGLTGLLMVVAYVPAYLLLYLIWFVALAAALRPRTA